MDYYHLVGYLNLFGEYPDFVYPIFSRYRKYFFQNPNNQDIIETFIQIDRKIQFTMLPNVNRRLSVNDEAIYAFQLDENTILCDTRLELYRALKQYDLSGYISEYITEFSQVYKITTPDLSIQSLKPSYYEELKNEFPLISCVAKPSQIYGSTSFTVFNPDKFIRNINNLSNEELSILRSQLHLISLQLDELLSNTKAMVRIYPESANAYDPLAQMQHIYLELLSFVDHEISHRAAYLPPD